MVNSLSEWVGAHGQEECMSHAAVTLEDLLADFDLTAAKWKEFFAANPGAAEVPTDIAGSGTVGGLVCHIYAAAVRNSERLFGEPVSELGTAKDLDAAWELKSKASANLQRYLKSADDASLDEFRRLQFRAAGELAVSQRKLCLHIFVHAIRHWAQIGPLVRQAGYPVGWAQDILFSSAIR
jgi:uncharacterized damage-inducible protein DinB